MSIYREYDIRGIVGTELTEALTERIGRAYATLARGRGIEAVAVGRDGRLTSPALHERLLAGLTASGLQVCDLGICPTPVLYFSLFHLPVGGGIMVTGSHNAAEYNGFKLCMGTEALHGDDIQAIRTAVEAGRFHTGRGTVESTPIIPEYLGFLSKDFGSVSAEHLHVVIDCGNATASLVARDALDQMGCRVTVLYGDLDGRFPHHHPDPTVEDNLEDLKRMVERTGADLGIGYDGDADRIGVVDEKGGILWGDRLMVLYARDILRSRPGCTIISEVKASQILYDEIARCGGRPVMWKTGHSLMKAKMKAEKAVLAGEMSGHMFFADRYFGYDDAIYASCRLIEILTRARKPISTLLADLPATTVTPEIRLECPDDRKFEVVDRMKSRLAAREQSGEAQPMPRIRDVLTIDGLRVLFDEGWGLVRASNTQPALVLRFEGRDGKQLTMFRTYLESELEKVYRELAIPYPP